MAHFAELDENNIVVRVLVTSGQEIDEGYQWLVENLGGVWVKTSYNSLGGIHYLPDEIRDENGNRVPSGKPHLRYNFAGIGFIYDPIKDAFIPPKPEQFILNKGKETEIIYDFELDNDTCLWKPVRIK